MCQTPGLVLKPQNVFLASSHLTFSPGGPVPRVAASLPPSSSSLSPLRRWRSHSQGLNGAERRPGEQLDTCLKEQRLLSASVAVTCWE